jgi:hypothetical protein
MVLWQALKRVQKADYTDKVTAVLTAAEDDQLGSYAPAAMAKLTTAAAIAAAASEAAKRGAAALEVSSNEHILLTSRCKRCRCLVNVCPPRRLKDAM